MMIKLVLWISAAVLLAAGPVSADFAYGVSVPDTGDVKAHRQIATPDGRIEGEYRWLQPNGLYRVTRYFVDGDSGYHAFVSEEPGEEIIENFYTNTHDFQRTSSQISNNVKPDNNNQESPVSSGRNHQNLVNRFQKTPNTFGQNNEILSDATVVGENTKLISNLRPTSQRFKRTSPLFNGEFPSISSRSFSRASSSSFGSDSESQSGSSAKSSGPGGSSSSQSFSSSSSSNYGSSSSAESFSSTGSFYPQELFRSKRSPEPQSFSRASSGAFTGNGRAQSSSQSSSGAQGFGADSLSFSLSLGNAFGDRSGAQSSSQSSSGAQGFGGSQSFSEAFANAFGGGSGAQSSSGSSSSGFNNGFGRQGNNGFGGPGGSRFGSGFGGQDGNGFGGQANNRFGGQGGSSSFSTSSAGAGGFNNGFNSFSRSSAGSFGK